MGFAIGSAITFAITSAISSVAGFVVGSIAGLKCLTRGQLSFKVGEGVVDSRVKDFYLFSLS